MLVVSMDITCSRNDPFTSALPKASQQRNIVMEKKMAIKTEKKKVSGFLILGASEMEFVSYLSSFLLYFFSMHAFVSYPFSVSLLFHSSA